MIPMPQPGFDGPDGGCKLAGTVFAQKWLTESLRKADRVVGPDVRR